MKTIEITQEILKGFDKKLKAQLQNDLKNFKNSKGRFLANNNNWKYQGNNGFQIA